MGSPLPSRIAELLGSPATSRSLLFDKGVDTYGSDWRFGSDGKRDFLRDFARLDKVDLQPFNSRRQLALRDLVGARRVELTAQTRLVVGLGLPQPIETGFLLDRLTGSPYLPGSSVKGVLRAASRRVATGELTLEGDPGDDAAFFGDHHDRLFGPALAADVDAAKGQLIAYDAFPPIWPKLEVDVLTPHQGDYYVGGTETVPGDWHDPVPVPFLTVAAGTSFVFYLRCGNPLSAESDLARLERLLRGALDELGIGGKTAAGYGFFGSGKPLAPREVSSQTRRSDERPTSFAQRPPRDPKPAAPNPPPKIAESLWKGQTLQLAHGRPTAFRGKQTAKGRLGDLGADLQKALLSHKKIRADLRVVKGIGGDWQITSIDTWTVV